MKRVDSLPAGRQGRKPSELRQVKITRNFLKYPEGSVCIEMGNTKVICTASVNEGVPHFLRNSGRGWVTAEYAMLPRATQQRTNRDHKGKGRTHEIQRLIGRSLRSIVDMTKLGERTIYLDCDVIQADGGTRTASVTGAYMALYDAIAFLRKEKKIDGNPLKEHLAAISVGIINDIALLDLCYEEDFKADVDMNIVMTESGKFVEVQGTAEGEAFSKELMDNMITLAQKGIKELINKQKACLNLKRKK